MKNEFSLSNSKAMLNFSAKYCDTTEKLINSKGFATVVKSFVKKNGEYATRVYHFLVKLANTDDEDEQAEQFLTLIRLLTIMDFDRILSDFQQYHDLKNERSELHHTTEELYNYWRKLERYSVINQENGTQGLETTNFVQANTDFSQLVLQVHRKVEHNIIRQHPLVFRQVQAGVNVGMVLTPGKWTLPPKYEILEGIPFIKSIILEAPFITYPKKNKRDGLFGEVQTHPLEGLSMNKDHFFCYPAKIGDLLAYLYFHRDLLSHGVSVANLFQMAESEEYLGKKPDIVYVFGAKQRGEVVNVFYDDEENNIMVGLVTFGDKVDYFGYMKKMSLTLHNLIQIKRGKLPIHGAMVNIVMQNGKSANVCIIGDSGAGKSESLEAFRSLSETYIRDMTIVFDDMGTFQLKQNEKPYAYGTEIGAFVRLDDLDQGYAFKEIDRSIFMNPDKTNARLIMPVATYAEIMKGYPIDILLYANNYDELSDEDNAVRYFDGVDNAIEVFRRGSRMSKGTTTETGLVDSYFANPFGPAQKQEETEVLLQSFMEDCFDKGVKVGELLTQLGIEGRENTGPKRAAIDLFEIIKNLN